MKFLFMEACKMMPPTSNTDTRATPQDTSKIGGSSRLSAYVIIFGWLALGVYLQNSGDFSDLSSFIKHFLAPDHEGIRYRALLFFTPLFFTIIGYLIHEKEKHLQSILKYQEELHGINDSLEYRVKMQTDEMERTNRKLRKEINHKKEINNFLALLEKAVMTTNTGITFFDMDYIIRFINEADARMHGYRIEELLGKDVRVLAPVRSSNPMDKEKIKSITSWARESINIRRDGSEFPVALTSDLVKDDAGQPIGVITTCEDITERKRVREDLYRSLEEKDVLLQEVHHRVKNNMQIINSLLQMHINYSQSQSPVEAFRDLQRRISSMALIHNSIYSSDDFANLRLSNFVNDIVSMTKRTSPENIRNIRVDLDIDDSTLEINRLVPFGLLVNELVSYSFKANTPETPLESINLKVKSHDNILSLLFHAEYSAGSQQDSLKDPDTLSITLAKSLSEQLGGNLEFTRDNTGQKVSLQFPS